jgi:hypothetical protein
MSGGVLTAFGHRQVRDDLGITNVDSHHPRALPFELLSRRFTNATGATADDDVRHGFLRTLSTVLGPPLVSA